MKIPVVRLVLTGLVFALFAALVYAATPSSGTVSQSNPTVTWTGQIPIPPAAGSSSCSGPNNPGCDNFKLTITPPAATFRPYGAAVKTVSQNIDDGDLEVYDPNGERIGRCGDGSGTPSNAEVEPVTL